MLHDFLQVGDKIDVKQLDRMGVPLKQTRDYVSQLLDLIDANTISIAMPTGNGHMVHMETGVNYKLVFYTAKGLYQCSCNMLEAYRENNAFIAKVQLTSDLEKFQRRQYYRLECIHEIEYRLVTEEEILLKDKLSSGSITNSELKNEIRKKINQFEKQWLKASLIDLSGGGARFNSDEILKTGDKIRVKFDFIIGGELKKLEFGADIISSEKLLNRTGKYEHRTEFTDIEKNDRENLIKYIFEQERRRRRNEKV